MTFECQHCGQRLEADSDMAGSVVECPTCSRQITVPAASHPSGPSVAIPSVAAPASRFNPRQKAAARDAIILIICALFFASLTVILWKMRGIYISGIVLCGLSLLAFPFAVLRFLLADPRTSRTAIASFMMGTFGVILGPVGSVSAILCGHVAMRRIRKSNGEVSGGLLGLTGLVLGYVCLALFLLAIPSFLKARDDAIAHQCRNSLRLISAAKEQVMLDKHYTPGVTIAPAEISVYIYDGLESHQCPKGGSYTIAPAGQPPVCSVHGALSDTTGAHE